MIHKVLLLSRPSLCGSVFKGSTILFLAVLAGAMNEEIAPSAGTTWVDLRKVVDTDDINQNRNREVPTFNNHPLRLLEQTTSASLKTSKTFESDSENFGFLIWLIATAMGLLTISTSRRAHRWTQILTEFQMNAKPVATAMETVSQIRLRHPSHLA